VLFILFFYSYTKRFTSYSHLVLGLCLGMAPLGAWIAIRGDVGLPPILLCVIVTLWTAGFDIIYSCQDTDFDQTRNLFSIPKRFGIKAALRISTGLHLLMFFFLIVLLRIEELGWISLAGTAVVAGLLYYEHRLVRPNDLSKVNAAFFTVNGYISILLLIAIGLDKLI
jgi:4-hydroxybenzoate polyprenyltransferase